MHLEQTVLRSHYLQNSMISSGHVCQPGLREKDGPVPLGELDVNLWERCTTTELGYTGLDQN